MNLNIRGFNVIDRLFSDPNSRRLALAHTVRAANTLAKPRDMYALLKAFYDSNGVYDALAANLHSQGVWQEGMKGLRNPAFRVVEAHVGWCWPGTLPDALPIETDNERIVPAIEQVWEWSNWGSQKQVMIRWLAMYGDVFVKVAQREDRSRVFFQLIDPSYVSDFDTDERGFLTYIRIDVPQVKRTNDSAKQVTVTEVWSKDLQSYRTWEHEQGQDADLKRLGPPDVEQPLSAFGIDFVPFQHVMFRDVGESRGVGAFTQSLDKIDEANRQATRLYQMLFRSNKDTWVLAANGTDKDDRPMPPPRLGEPGTEITVEDQTIISLPGNATLTSLVPNINYAAALSILQDHMGELADDLPELTYWRLRDLGDLSGIAVRRMLSGAITRALEARGNAESGLIRLDQMALTMGAESPFFRNIGTFEAGDFQHSFKARPVIATEPLEEAQEDLTRAQAGVLKAQIGMSPREILKRDFGMTDDEIDVMKEENAESVETVGDAVIRRFDRGA